MPNFHHTTHALRFLTDFSERDRQLAERALRQQQERRRKADESRARKADELVERQRRELSDLLGARKLGELRDAMKRERLAFRDLWQPPVDPDRDYRKENRARKRRVDAVLRKLEASPEQLRELGARSHQALRETLAATDGKVAPGYSLANHLDRWTSLSPLHAFPLPWGTLAPVDDPSDPHRWFLFRPPFFGFLFDFAPQASDNFRVDRLLFLEPPTGLVGNEATMDCGDAMPGISTMRRPPPSPRSRSGSRPPRPGWSKS
jgi:hypothetical protein